MLEERLDPEAVMEEFELLSRGAGRVQRETLQRILDENGSTEYLQRFGLNGRTDPDSFKACVPIVSHSDLEHYIQRVANGSSPSALTGKPITTISLSSGTTQGKPKFVPFNNELMESTMQIYKTSFSFRNREYPITKGKALQFIYGSKQFKTKGGLAGRWAESWLYRYRLGDVVKVKGFHNATPELQFVCRRNLLLTINIDKNTEKDLQLAVEAAARLVADEKLEVVDFTSCVDSSEDPGHYVVFWEVSGDPRDEVLQDCCDCLDRSFVDASYVSSRKTRAIGPLELRIVRRGTFHKILDHYVGLGAAVSQFKTPGCVGPTNATVLQILSANGDRRFFSTAF